MGAIKPNQRATAKPNIRLRDQQFTTVTLCSWKKIPFD